MYIAKIPDPHVVFRESVRDNEFYHRSFLIHNDLFLTLMFAMFLRSPLPMPSPDHVTLDWFEGVSLEQHFNYIKGVSLYFNPDAVERRGRVAQELDSIWILPRGLLNMIADYDVNDDDPEDMTAHSEHAREEGGDDDEPSKRRRL